MPDSTGDLFGRSGAQFSSDRRYRYTLWRWWDRSKDYVMFVGLNPSTADEVQNDPTVARCINFAHRWGYGGMYMMNIFAYRATDPREMKDQDDPVGPDNDYWLLEISGRAALIVAAWGVHGNFRNRGNEVLELLQGMHCLGTTKEGHPRHPLYLRNDVKPIPYEGSPVD